MSTQTQLIEQLIADFQNEGFESPVINRLSSFLTTYTGSGSGVGGTSLVAGTDYVKPGQCVIYHSDGTTTTITSGGPESAFSSAADGELIVVGAGSYTVTTNLLSLSKPTLNWHFQRGVTITRASGDIFSFSGVSGTATFSITGHGDFIASNGQVLVIARANSLVEFQCHSAESNGSGNNVIKAGGNGTIVKVTFEKHLKANDYEPIYTSTGTAIIHVTGPYLYGGTHCISADAGGTVFANIQKCEAVSSLVQNSGSTVYLTFDTFTQAQGSTDPALNYTGAAGGIIRGGKIAGYLSISSSGNLRLANLLVDSTGLNNPSLDYTGGSNLTLVNCQFTTDTGQTNSISSTGATTATVIGDLNINKAVSNVTLLDGSVKNVAQATFARNLGGISANNGRILFTQTANGTCGNTGTETTVISTGIGGLVPATGFPANYFVAGKTVKIKAKGFYKTKLSNAGTLRIRLYLGAVALFDTTAVTLQTLPLGDLSAQNNVCWEAEFILTCRQTGASATIMTQGDFSLYMPTQTIWIPIGDVANTAAANVDTTAVQTLALKALWGTSDVANIITCTNLTVEELN